MTNHPSLDELRAEVTEVLRGFVARDQAGDLPAAAVRAADSDRVSLPIVTAMSEEEERAALARARAFQRTLYDAGLAWLSGPPELGGRGLSSQHERVLAEALASFDLPDRSALRTGTRIIAPSIASFAPELARSQLPRIHAAEVVVCQLFSEPDAGSDLANVRTRAVPTDTGWELTGQKVWSSGAHFSDLGACLARTSDAQPKHTGLTMFLVDLRAPGVEVRPIRQMTGGAEFDEVFLEQVHVDDSHRIGEVGQGWAVALHMLMNERSAIGDELLPGRELSDRLVDLLDRVDAPEDVRLEAADILAHLLTTRWMVDDIVAATEEGSAPGPELAGAKLAVTDDAMRIGTLVTDLLGSRLTADTGAWGTFAWTEFLLGVHGLRVGGGTDEILKNTLGERVLGLPREPRPRPTG